jgi:LuxR family maltose regulon positive regulatory protein
MAVLKLTWLGVPGVEIDGHPLRLEMRKTLALLAYLSLSGHNQTRETLASLFWPEHDQKHALASLRRNLFSLSQSLPAGLLEADRETIGLRRDDSFIVDVHEFMDLVTLPKRHEHSSNWVCPDCLAALEKAASIYRGDFFEGFNLKDCPAFDEWQFFQRESLRSEYAGALERLAAYFQGQEEWEKAIDHARRWVAQDRFNEPAQRRLIDLYRLSGQRSLALQQFGNLEELLRDELDQAPEAETISLYETLLQTRESGATEEEAALPPPMRKPEPLIKTKLLIPPFRTNQVTRLRLFDQLEAATKHPFTLVSAPAGYGKTTLLASWTVHTDLPIAWFSIDEGDNDPLRFATYLIAALDSVLPQELSEHFQAFTQSLQPSIQPVLIQLINLLSTRQDPFVLILDDYQFIHSQAIHQALQFLLEKIPACMRLVMATRNDPPISLALLRGRNQLTEIRMNDLRFGMDESAGFLRQVMSLRLKDEDISALEACTEGWIASLQMAAVAIRTLASRPGVEVNGADSEQAVSGFIRAFSGSHRYILDYLSEEVLKHCSERLRTFLLQTSILERFSAPLCDVVTEAEGSQAVLEELEKENLFLVPLDNERQWYRYHHLFAELLRFSLESAYSEGTGLERKGFPGVERLHRRAAEWFERHGLFEEAVRHFLAARQYDRAAVLITSQAHLMIFNTGQTYTLAEWLSALPQDLFRSEPRLKLLKAWALASQNQFAAAAEQAETCWKAVHERTGEEISGLIGEISLIQGVLAELGSRDVIVMREKALLAWEKLPESDAMLRCLAAWLLAESYYWDGDARKAEEYFVRAIPLCRAAGNIYFSLVSSADLSAALWEQGRFREAYNLLWRTQQEMTLEGRQPHPRLGQLYISSSKMLLQWNRLEEAEKDLHLGIELAERDTPEEMYFLGMSILPYIKFAQGESEEASRLAGACLDRIEQYPLQYLPRLIRSNFVHLWILLKDNDRLEEWVNGCGLKPNGLINYRNEGQYISLAEVLLFQGRPEKAQKILSRLHATIQKRGGKGKLFHILMLQALAYKQLDATDQALEALGESLRLVKSAGLIRPFVEGGKQMQELLEKGRSRELWRQKGVENLADQLLQAF